MSRKSKADLLTIGAVAERSGVAPSALRFYESLGLLTSERSSANHRVYPRHVLRRVAFVRVAQRMGLTLDEISEALSLLPADRAPTAAEWRRISSAWQQRLNDRIATLERLRDDLTGCIGCGCLSLRTCRLYNHGDTAAERGAGARYLLGDEPPEP